VAQELVERLSQAIAQAVSLNALLRRRPKFQALPTAAMIASATFVVEGVWPRHSFASEFNGRALNETVGIEHPLSLFWDREADIARFRHGAGIRHLQVGVLFPVGHQPQTPDIWKAAFDQKLLPTAVDARLNPLRPYLFGSVKNKDFDVVKFAEAAKALEELAAPPAPV
jgi:hypothetical protein